MSIRAMSWAWQQVTTSSGERLVLLALADHAGEDDECWPYTARIAEKCDLTRVTVQRHLTALHDRGLITKVERRMRRDGGLGGWLYRLNVDESRHSVDAVSGFRGITEGVSLDASSTLPLRHITDDGSIEEPSMEPTDEPTLVVGVVVDGFDSFWQQYPRKVARPAARRAWDKLGTVDRRAALDRLPEQVDYWRATITDGRFIPHPTTWLNQRRWEDDLPARSMTGKTAAGMAMVRQLMEGNN